MASMQFWGVAVEAEEPCKISLDDGYVIHLSQATLSKMKKDNKPVAIKVKVDGKELVLGMLNQTTPQLMFDLVFDTDFEISHNWKNGSVHLMGYKTEMPDEYPFYSFCPALALIILQISDCINSSDEEDIQVPDSAKENGNVAAPAPVVAAKPNAAAKPGKDNKPKPEANDDSDDDDDSDDEGDDSDDESDEDMLSKSEESGDEDDDDDDDDEDDSSSEDDEPAKSASGKKRPNADAKTPESKKAKLVTPQKTDGKKGGAHTATPHPSKKVGKSPGGDKSTTKSGGQASCTPCKKTFNSGTALQSHNKAKHAA
ncbi:Histone deacetylase HDT1 [Bienertia sinuspersici]